MNNKDIEIAFERVQKAIEEYDAPTIEGRQALDELDKNLKAWFPSKPRILPDVPESCIEYFLNAEFDADTPGNRGLGRLSEFVPRLAARHRSIFRGLAPEGLAELRKLIRQHILCGYLFLEANADFSRVTDDLSGSLLGMWIPLLYSSSGGESLDGELKKFGESYDWAKSLWFGATSKQALDFMTKLGIVVEQKDGLILLHYFDAGMILRYLEFRPLTKTQLMDVSTAGGYSRSMANEGGQNEGTLRRGSTGCLIVLAAIAFASYLWLGA